MKYKNLLLDPIIVGERTIFPIATVDIGFLNNNFFKITQKISAFKIIEGQSTYFINNDLSEKELDNLKKVVEEV